MADTPRPIRGMTFLQALADAGVIEHGDRVRRVVIDAPVGDMVSVYVERYGDERLLSVATTLEGVKVVTTDG